MDKTIHDLGEILLKAIPTLILFILLNIYLKAMFFTPLQKVLAKRREATEGARESAEAGLKSAAERTAEYEAKLRDARTEIYKEQEETRKRWVDQQTRLIQDAREKTQAMVLTAKQQIAQDIEGAKHDLAGSSNLLAEQISNALLKRRAN